MNSWYNAYGPYGPPPAPPCAFVPVPAGTDIEKALKIIDKLNARADKQKKQKEEEDKKKKDDKPKPKTFNALELMGIVLISSPFVMLVYNFLWHRVVEMMLK